MASNSDLQGETASALTINSELVERISALVDQDRFDEALLCVKPSTTSEQHEQQIYNGTWDLCTYLFHLAEQPSDKLCNDYEIFAEDALTYVAEHGNAREMLIIMQEQADKFISDHAYCLYMKLFVSVIKRLPLRRSLISSIRDVLSLLRCHLDTLELPSITNDIQGTDLLMFNHDRRVVHLLDLTQWYVNFICQLRDHFSSSIVIENNAFDIEDIRLELARSLVSLLQKPLAALSYEPINQQESSSFTAIKPLLDCIFTLRPNPLLMLKNEGQLSSVLVYLLLTKISYFSLLPCVYSPFFYLLFIIPYVQQLSDDRERTMLTEKACVLVSDVCSRLSPNNEFDQHHLENDQIHSLIDTLKVLLVQSPARQYASLTIGAYQYLLKAFTPLGRYAFLRQQLAKTPVNEDSYRTFLCKLVKDEFLLDYRSSGEVYKGQSLFTLLDFLCRLPNGVESDLLEIHDCLISTLNFVRFIGLVDKRQINRTLLWTERLPHLRETFVKPLRKSIDIARAHYKLELKQKQEEKSSIKAKNELMETEVLIGDKHLPVPTRQEQLETMHSALVKFDILDCVLSCVSETFGDEL